jgi:phosphatidylglycerol lysyltransferase
MASVTLCVGVLDLYSLMGRAAPERARILRQIFPLEFVHTVRFATLLTGFALVIVSASLWRRKKRAWQVLVLVTGVSVALHLAKGLDYENALLSLGLLTLLFATRKVFSVRSRIPDLRGGSVRLGLAVGVALAYGIAGFWFLDPREFGVNFHLGDAVHRTLLFLTLQGDPSIAPHTRHARWFLDSMYLTTAVTLAYAIFELFRPVVYRFRTLPNEKEHAMGIVSQYGRTGLDYFKLWHDKSFFFSASGKSFLAYKVGKGYARYLGTRWARSKSWRSLCVCSSMNAVRTTGGWCFTRRRPPSYRCAKN